MSCIGSLALQACQCDAHAKQSLATLDGCRQVLVYKKENQQLKEEVSHLQEELDNIMDLATSSSDQHTAGSNSVFGRDSFLDGNDRPHSAATGNRVLSRPSSSSSNRRSSAPGSRVVAGNRPASAAAAGAGATNMEGRMLVCFVSYSMLHHRCMMPYVENDSMAVAMPRSWSLLWCCCIWSPGDIDVEAVHLKMERYSKVINNLKKLLESERRQLRQARAAYNTELGRRNELQNLLLDSIDAMKEKHR